MNYKNDSRIMQAPVHILQSMSLNREDEMGCGNSVYMHNELIIHSPTHNDIIEH